MSDIIPFSENSLAVLQHSQQELAEIIQGNLGGDTLSEWDLDKVKVPSGGGTTWQVPSLDGEEAIQSLDGIIIHWGNRRAYWEDSFSGSNEPPQCNSQDGIHGVGDPGGECASCQYAQFQSADDGVGQACKATRVLFMLKPDSLIPIVVTLPPASLGNAKKYFLRLVGAGVAHTSLVTKLTLTKDKSKGGITFSRVELTAGQRLSPDAAHKVAEFAAPLKTALDRIGIEREDIGGG